MAIRAAAGAETITESSRQQSTPKPKNPIELRCPECNSQHFLVRKGEVLSLESTLTFTCADCHVTSPRDRIVAVLLAQKQVRGLIEEAVYRKNLIRTLEKLIKMRGLVPLTQDEKLRIMIGAPIDWAKVQVLRSKPQWDILIGSVC